ncbi:alpha/beta hydrolase [Nonomuraea indica]|uniref:Alpha/beta hydrolase n=1 Tax=Nonomuraea indica TaxID=1581193 RepID=A0ABW7ZWS2_9ACTN
MKRINPRRLVSLSLVLAVTTASLPPGAAEAADASIAWSPCAQDATAECGTLTVPVDWDDRDGPTIELALARRKATEPAARIGSLVINPGGPGVSGVDYALAATNYLSPELTRRFDIVGFDPRGVGRSHPVVCSSALLREMPGPVMKSQADLDARLAYNRRLRQDCRNRTGPLFDHVSTLSVVRDVDALRAALGDDRLTYYGVSYGTLIGQQYAERYPRRVRAVALDSNFDHSLGTAAYLETAAAGAQRAFEQFTAWCARTASCALHGTDVPAFWARLLARAERGELHPPGQPDTPLTAYDLIDYAFATFYGPNWAELAQWLVAVDRRDEQPSAAATPETDHSQDVRPFPRQVFCSDFHLPVRDHREYAALLRRQAAVAADMRYSPAALHAVAACLGRPAPVPNPQHRLQVDGTPPILLANALYDPTTGHRWAAGVAAQIGAEARLLTYEGWGHGTYGRSDCLTDAVDRYLVSLTPPAKDARCAAVPPPG